MTRRMTTHDAFFRGAMMGIEVARDFLKQHLPKDIQKIVKLDTLKLEPSTFINKELKKRIADLLYSVEILGEEGYIYFLIEQHSVERYRSLYYLCMHIRIHGQLNNLSQTADMSLDSEEILSEIREVLRYQKLAATFITRHLMIYLVWLRLLCIEKIRDLIADFRLV